MNPLQKLRCLDLPLLRLTTLGMASLEQVQFRSAEWVAFVALRKRCRVHVLHLRIFPIDLRRRSVPLTQIHHLVLDVVLGRARSSVVYNHISCQSTNIGVVRKLRYLRSVDLGIIDVVQERGELLLVVRVDLVAVLDRLRMPVHHVPTLRYNFVLATNLGHI